MRRPEPDIAANGRAHWRAPTALVRGAAPLQPWSPSCATSMPRCLQVVSDSSMGHSGTARYAHLLSQMWHTIHATELQTVYLSSKAPTRLLPRDRVLVHLGTNDGLAFDFCRRVTALQPDAHLILLCHDPPHFPKSKRLWMEALAGSRVGRGVRAAANHLWGERFDRELSSTCSRWIVMSEAGRAALRAHLQRLGCADAHITVIPHGLYDDGARIEQVAPRPRLQLGFFGHITPSKGLHVVVEALAQLAKTGSRQPAPRLVVAGAPDSRHSARYLLQVQRRVQKLQLGHLITFRGHLAENELADFFRGIDVLVLPYQRPTSCSASGPLHLALTYGRPVVCSQSPYFDEAVSKTGVGYTVEAASVAAWADTLDRLTRNSGELSQLTDSIVAMRPSHAWRNVAEMYTQVLTIPL